VDLPHGSPGVYDVTLGAELHLTGDADRLALAGDVSVIDGKYIEQFDVVKNAIIRPRTHEESAPLWKGRPLLENMELDLRVRSAGPIYVENDIAHQLKLDLSLAVGGTVSDPELDGEVIVREGAFRIPFLRGDDFIALPGGTVQFYPGKQIPRETPEVNIQAEK